MLRPPYWYLLNLFLVSCCRLQNFSRDLVLDAVPCSSWLLKAQPFTRGLSLVELFFFFGHRFFPH